MSLEISIMYQKENGEEVGPFDILPSVMEWDTQYLKNAIENKKYFKNDIIQSISKTEIYSDFLNNKGKVVNLHSAMLEFIDNIGGVDNFSSVKKRYSNIRDLNFSIENVEREIEKLNKSEFITGPNRFDKFEKICNFNGNDFCDSYEVEEYLEEEDSLPEEERFTFPYVSGVRNVNYKLNAKSLIVELDGLINSKRIDAIFDIRKKINFLHHFAEGCLENSFYNFTEMVEDDIDMDKNLNHINTFKRNITRYLLSNLPDKKERLYDDITKWNAKQTFYIYFEDDKTFISVRENTTKEDALNYLNKILEEKKIERGYLIDNLNTSDAILKM